MIKHLEYLSRISSGDNPSDNPLITDGTAELSVKVWLLMWMASGWTLAVPDAAPTPDRELLLIWQSGGRYLDAELIEGRPVEFYFRDESGVETWNIEGYEPNAPLPDQLVAVLHHFSESAA